MMSSGGGVTVRGGGIKVCCCVSGTGAGICTLGSFGRGERGVGGTCVDDFDGTLGDDVGLSFEKDGMGGREMGCFDGKRGDGVRGGYMFSKTCASCLRAACWASPTMFSGVG